MTDSPSARPRLVGVDYGTRRVGLAVADPLRLFARPYGTFDPDAAVEALHALAAQDGIETIVVGWPLTPEGGEDEATERARQFANRLRRQFPQADVVPWDERGSSIRAREAIRAAGARRKARRERARVDAAAAALLLQEFLDDRDLTAPPPADPPER